MSSSKNDPVSAIFDLQRDGDNSFTAPVVPAGYPRTFGGQVVSQALTAAAATVEGKKVHSLHGYFLSGGDASKTAEVEVERLRDGRSFSSRQTRTYQDGILKFVLTANFQAPGGEGYEHQIPMRDVPAPEELGADAENQTQAAQGLKKQWSDWDIRVVDGASRGDGLLSAWFKPKKDLTMGPEIYPGIMAYLSDMLILQSAKALHGGREVQMASLDHAMWFTRELEEIDWLFLEHRSPSASGARSLGSEYIYDRQGRLVAMAVQEGLTRNPA